MHHPVGLFDYSNQQYHESEGISRSKLWTFKQLPSKYYHQYLSGKYEKPAYSDAFALGDAVHALSLEKDKFNDLFIVAPEIDRRTKQGKIDYAAFLESSAGKTILKPEIMEVANSMARELDSNSIFHDLTHGARMEKSIYWRHEATGLLCKARPDIWNGVLVSDLKTTQDAGYRAFQLSAYKYGYFLQAAMIYEAFKSIGKPFQSFVFVCIEKTPPYAIGIYMLDDEALQFGLDMFHSLMQRLARCYETNVWPDYGIQKLTIPKYATMETEIE